MLGQVLLSCFGNLFIELSSTSSGWVAMSNIEKDKAAADTKAADGDDEPDEWYVVRFRENDF
jgi:hypothetical protein